MAARGVVAQASRLRHVRDLGEHVWARVAPWSEVPAQAGATEQTAHRPWSLPDGPWRQGQTWRDLLFAHWPLRVDQLRDAVPRELPIDTFDGSAWLGIVPFRVTGLRLHGAPPLPPV